MKCCEACRWYLRSIKDISVSSTHNEPSWFESPEERHEILPYEMKANDQEDYSHKTPSIQSRGSAHLASEILHPKEPLGRKVAGLSERP